MYPTSQGAIKGASELSIKCYSKDKVSWFKGHKKLSSRNVVNNSLILQNIKLQDSGFYKCRGTLENNKVFIALSEVLIGGKLIRSVIIKLLNYIFLCSSYIDCCCTRRGLLIMITKKS